MFYQSCKKRLVIFGVASLLLFGSQLAQAEAFGLLNGRLADVSRAPKFSVDLGVVFDSDFSQLGIRGNFKVSPQLLLYGNLSFADFDGGGDIIPFGIGALYTIEGLLEAFDVGAKLSFHAGSFEVGTIDEDVTNLAFEIVGSCLLYTSDAADE